MPDSRLLDEHLSYWEDYLPFDGLVLDGINQEKNAGRYGYTGISAYPNIADWDLPHLAFSSQKADATDYTHVTAEIQSIHRKARKFKHNFIPIAMYCGHKVAPNEFDWFDDGLWSSIKHNVSLLAEIAQQSGCKGVWVDTESYPNILWDYLRLRLPVPRTRTWESFRSQVFERGKTSFRPSIVSSPTAS